MIFEICKPTSHSVTEYLVFADNTQCQDCFDLLRNTFPESSADYLIACYGQYDNAIEFGAALTTKPAFYISPSTIGY